MAGAEPRDPFDLGLVVDRFGAHLDGPVDPVTVFDPKRDGRTQRQAVPDAALDFGVVLLDLHPTAAAVATLASRKVRGDVSFGKRQAGRQAFDDHREAFAVALACRQPAKRAHQPAPCECRRSATKSAAASSAGRGGVPSTGSSSIGRP